MSSQIWMFLLFVYTILTVLGAIFDAAFGSLETGALSTINRLMQFKALTVHQIPGVGWPVPMPNLQLFADLASIMTWNFNFFRNNDLLNLVRLIVLLPLSAALGVGLVTVFGPLFLGAISGGFGLFRRLFGG